jgi:hypothetical protein
MADALLLGQDPNKTKDVKIVQKIQMQLEAEQKS